VIVGSASPPQSLYGTKLCAFHTGFYIARDVASSRSAAPAWLLGPNESVPPDWEPDAGIKMASVSIRFAEMRSQLEATRAGMGVSVLPCFLGDADPLLIRVPGGPITHVGDIWLLSHADTRRTKRVRLLCDHVRDAMQGFAGRLAGRIEGGAVELLWP
jgi:DNA-binding transcriptional LysR family regulator